MAPYATITIFGWAVNGPEGHSSQTGVTSYYATADSGLEDQVKMFWRIDGNDCDELGIYSHDDMKVLKL